ncbi:MAG TPA: DUF4129 domain-containing protein [Verrucomicrobiae bacterium]|nr:DUF4129 domain-containing protein [Verrucomicrobiae bacterium]
MRRAQAGARRSARAWAAGLIAFATVTTPVGAASGVAVAGSPAALRLARLVSQVSQDLRGHDPAAARARLAQAPRADAPDLAAVARALRSGRLGTATAALGALTAELRGGRRPIPSAATTRAALRQAYQDPAVRAGRAASGGAGGVPPSNVGWLRRGLADLFRLLPRNAWVVLGLALLAAGGALGLWRIRAAGARPQPASPDPRDGPGPPDPEAAWRLAQTAAGDGRHREAVRQAFHALLLTAARRHALRVDPAWTNAELLAAADAVGALGPRLGPLVSTFDRVVYGGEDPGADGWAVFARGCHAAEAALA